MRITTKIGYNFSLPNTLIGNNFISELNQLCCLPNAAVITK